MALSNTSKGLAAAAFAGLASLGFGASAQADDANIVAGSIENVQPHLTRNEAQKASAGKVVFLYGEDVLDVNIEVAQEYFEALGVNFEAYPIKEEEGLPSNNIVAFIWGYDIKANIHQNDTPGLVVGIRQILENNKIIPSALGGDNSPTNPIIPE